MQIKYEVIQLARMKEVDMAGVAMETQSECPLCQSSNYRDIAILKDSLISSECLDCHHLFHRQRPSSDWFLNWYHSSWDQIKDEKKKTVRSLYPLKNRLKIMFPFLSWLRKKDEAYNMCRPVMKKGMKVLEVGCGYGHNLLPFIQNGYTCFGIDPSEHRSLSVQKMGVQSKCTPLEKLDPETFGTQFDLVIVNHVLEHAVDPNLFLNCLSKVMKPQGYLYIALPNLYREFLLQQFFFALHIHCFSKQSLSLLLNKSGFGPVDIVEDRNLKILSQWGKELSAPQTNGFKDATCLLDEYIFSQVLGPDYANHEGQVNYCHWSLQPDPASPDAGNYKVVYQKTRDPLLDRGVQLQWQGTPHLPLFFESKCHPEQTPFWVK